MAYQAYSGGGVGGAIQAGDPATHVEGEIWRGNFQALAARRAVYPLGGSRHNSQAHDDVIDAYDYLDIEIDGTHFQTGMTVRARVDVRVETVAISVTPQIYNVTDASVAVTGAACSASSGDYSGTNQQQTLTFTPAVGVKKYRLRFTPSDNTDVFWGIGYLEVFV